MPSILPGYTYDIFISYRQKDNKYDGWITEFVANLKKELEATFKEDISIYFDENPHDGLLETHDVDDSLREKLKCLIFIPIISQTYCDPKSFAWNDEFLAFLKTAAADAYGLKIRIPNGNTASRVLPIRIHELDSTDKKLLETELLGPLRAIDFTFQSAGVNRPLRPKDDESSKGQTQNSYRDQINKTANAIKEIIGGLRRAGVSSSPLESVEAENESDPATVPPSRTKTKRNFRIPAINPLLGFKLLSIAAILAFLALAIYHFSQPTPDLQTYRSIIPPPPKTSYSTSFGGQMALSPDGRLMAFVAIDSTGKTLLWVRPLNALAGQAFNGTEGALFPFWSPDSRFIGFFADEKLKKVEASGGPPQIICDAPIGRGGAWNENGTIIFNAIFTPFTPLFTVLAAGGRPQPLTRLDTSRSQFSHRWPCFLPDGKHFLYSGLTITGGVGDEDAIFLASLDTSFTPRLVVKSSTNASYANGHLFFVREQTLMAQPFDPKSLQTTGDAFPVAEQVYLEPFTNNASFSVSQNGNLVYQTGTVQTGTRLLWYDRAGKRMGEIGQPAIHNDLRISPDGKRIAISQTDDKTGNIDLWLYEIVREVWTRFTFDPSSDRWPIWSRDGKTIVFASERKGANNLFQRAASGAGSEEMLLGSNPREVPSDWSPDGKFLVYTVNDPKKGNDIWILPMNPDSKGASEERKPFLFLQTEFSETNPVFSPDGRYIAYQSNESGRNEVHIRPFPGPGGKWQVSTNGGTRPRWRNDGKELFYMGVDNKIMAAEIRLGSSSVDVGAASTLFQTSAFTGGGRAAYDVTGDGQRFLVSSKTSEGASLPVTLVVNWVGEIKK